MSKTILFIDDNPNDAELAVRAFKKSEISAKVDVVNSGEEAFNYLYCKGIYELREINMKPSLIIIDINLPEISGVEIVKRLRSDSEFALIPIVMLTNSEKDEDMRRSYEYNANSYVKKPVKFEDFINALDLIARYWLSLNEAPYGGL